MYRILWDTSKAVLREKLVAIKIYINKLERFQINNPVIPLVIRKE